MPNMSIPRSSRTPFWTDSRKCPELGLGQGGRSSDDGLDHPPHVYGEPRAAVHSGTKKKLPKPTGHVCPVGLESFFSKGLPSFSWPLRSGYLPTW